MDLGAFNIDLDTISFHRAFNIDLDTISSLALPVLALFSPCEPMSDTFSQDPWSIRAKPLDAALPEPKASAKRKPKTLEECLLADKKKKPKPEQAMTAIDALADWSRLPPKESVWIRGLLDGGDSTSLEVLRCMREERLVPMQVIDALNSGRGKIIFYAKVSHAVACPRHLVFGNTIHCHSRNHAVVAVCITESIKLTLDSSVDQVKLFTRCFSSKCEVLLLIVDPCVASDNFFPAETWA